MPNHHLFLTLAMAVDTTVALLHDVGVVRDFQVNKVVTVVLQVDTFGSGVGGQQDAYGGNVWSGLECRLHLFSIIVIHAAVQDHQAIATHVMSRQNLM
ncbi:hypothetical protein D3C78_1116600 [compost metagenome]